jgi:hypothetical protein
MLDSGYCLSFTGMGKQVIRLRKWNKEDSTQIRFVLLDESLIRPHLTHVLGKIGNNALGRLFLYLGVEPPPFCRHQFSDFPTW